MKAILLILDGAGIAPADRANAITSDTMPYLFGLMSEHGHAVLASSGPAVGLDDGAVGNSEVGHLPRQARILARQSRPSCGAGPGRSNDAGRPASLPLTPLPTLP